MLLCLVLSEHLDFVPIILHLKISGPCIDFTWFHMHDTRDLNGVQR